MAGIEENKDFETGGDLDLSRRKALRLIGASGTMATSIALSSNPSVPDKVTSGCGPLSDEPEDGESWKIAVLPDTQKYAQRGDLTEYGEMQTKWIANNLEEENIEFVTHEGDLVHNGYREVEWERIDDIMANLDEAEVPYGVVPGNHDWAANRDKSSSIENYLERFGESRFEDRDWYLGSGPGELSHHQKFSVNDNDFLHVGLEWEPRDETLEWAEEVINEHDATTFVTVHSYLTDKFMNKGHIDYVTEESGRGNHGEYTFENFVSENDQIAAVFCGHKFANINPFNEGEYNQISQNDSGEDVYEMLANFQTRNNGGNGWMRLVEFKPGEGSCYESPDRIDVKTYSPALDRFQLGSASDFSYELDFEERFIGYER